MAHAEKVVASQHTSFISDLTTSGKLGKFIIGMVDSEDVRRTADFLRDELTKQTLKNASYSVDAASLVFAHTVLDDAMNSFLEITSEVARDYWEQCVKKKKVELEQIMSLGLKPVLGKLINKEIWGIRRNDSMIKRAELLHLICKPVKVPVHANYKFDSDRLRWIDKCRQDIVHGDMLGDEIPQIDETLQYLFDTWMYFFLMMNETFGLRVDPSLLASAGKEPKK